MESIIKLITEKTGISEANAKTAVETVLSFLKDKLPAGISGQVESLITGGTGSASDLAGELKDKITGAFGM